MGPRTWFHRWMNRHNKSVRGAICLPPWAKRVRLFCERLEDRLVPAVSLQYGGPGQDALLGESSPGTDTIQISEFQFGFLKIDLGPIATFDAANSTPSATGLNYQTGSPGTSHFATLDIT